MLLRHPQNEWSIFQRHAENDRDRLQWIPDCDVLDEVACPPPYRSSDPHSCEQADRSAPRTDAFWQGQTSSVSTTCGSDARYHPFEGWCVIPGGCLSAFGFRLPERAYVERCAVH